MSKAVNSLPSHLNQFIDQQNYAKYSPRDHAVWRYILKQNVSYFGNRGFAVSEYSKGLNLTGISLDAIPNIQEMDASLDTFGWGAVPVCGFIPPVAFLEFQSYGVLPIAHNMRSVDHIGYTPAPDIVHESAGHAPILVNEVYADYLKKYARIAGKAISSKRFVQQYEAIRKLSDLKELTGVAKLDILNAEEELNKLSGEHDDISESAQVVRLYWWTAEYGLLGDMNSPKVFGAGLLSSVDESQNCLRSDVKKIPFSIDCINYSYDITKPQPQLFVVRKFEDLLRALDEMEKLLAFHVGGDYGLKKAIDSETVVTAYWKNGAFYSGVIKSFKKINEHVQIMNLEGPCQIGFNGNILEPCLTISQKQIFLPIGMPQNIFIKDLIIKVNQLKVGDQIKLDYGNNFSIAGRLIEIKGNQKTISLLKLQNVVVTFNDSAIKHDFFYLPIGENIVSVSGGPFHQDSFKSYDIGKASTKPIQEIINSSKQQELFDTYERIHHLEKNMKPNEFKRLCSFLDDLFSAYPKEWLLWLEALQMLQFNKKGNIEMSSMILELNQRIVDNQNNLSNSEVELLEKGLRVLDESNLKG